MRTVGIPCFDPRIGSLLDVTGLICPPPFPPTNKQQVFTWRAVVCAVCQRAGRALPLLWGRVVRVLEGTAAVVKVGLLLSLKMLFLPLLLGLWLDAATQPVLGPAFERRVRFATENLVGALLLHWVAGISFMLVVTVSVLQLRECVLWLRVCMWVVLYDTG